MHSPLPPKQAAEYLLSVQPYSFSKPDGLWDCHSADHFAISQRQQEWKHQLAHCFILFFSTLSSHSPVNCDITKIPSYRRAQAKKRKAAEATTGVPFPAAKCSLAPSPRLYSVKCNCCTSLLSVIYFHYAVHYQGSWLEWEHNFVNFSVLATKLLHIYFQ